jgi:hypothetical protein
VGIKLRFGAIPGIFWQSIVALWPPNPKELFTTTLTLSCRAVVRDVVQITFRVRELPD